MGDGTTNLVGIAIPSTNPVFLTVVGVHILLGLACTVTGAIAMLSACGDKRRRAADPAAFAGGISDPVAAPEPSRDAFFHVCSAADQAVPKTGKKFIKGERYPITYYGSVPTSANG